MMRIHDKYKNINMLSRILLTVSSCIFIYSAGTLSYKIVDDYRSKKTYEEIGRIYNPILLHKEKYVQIPAVAYEDVLTDNILLKQVEEKRKEEERLKVEEEEKRRQEEERQRLEEEERLKKEAEERQAAFKSLQKINKDAVGYIYIKNSDISYPVVQGEDNEYYLGHDARRRTSQHGAIFMDAGNNVTDGISGQNIVLYGHYMKDGSMFTGLRSFRERSFFQDNPVIEFDILGQKHEWQVFSEYIVEGAFNYRQTHFESSSEFNDFISRIKDKSLQYRKTNITSKDTILTLSTCAYDFEDARLVIHAKLIN